MVRDQALFRYVRKYSELKAAEKVRVGFRKLTVVIFKKVFNEDGEETEDSIRISRPGLEDFIERVQKERIRLEQIINDAQEILADYDKAEIAARKSYEDQLARGVRTPE